MTIKEFCKNHEKCKDCSFYPACSYDDYYDVPLFKINDENSDKITKAIIETAKILKEGINND